MSNSGSGGPADRQRGAGGGLSACAPSGESVSRSLTGVVDALCGPCNGGNGTILRGPGHAALPSRAVVIAVVEDLRGVLFPGYFGKSELTTESMRYHVGSTLDRILDLLQEQLRRGLCFVCEKERGEQCHDCDEKALRLTMEFLSRLPRVQQLLAGDALAAYEGDPAATTPDEAVFCYPGLMALTNYRIAHELHQLEVPLLPRMITEHAHSITGIDIHPGATIGEHCFIDHGTGVVIGETAIIGRKVSIYQGVTLGAKSFPLDENGNPIKGMPRHPIVEDEVVIYAGATILGRITLGKGSVVGGNVWLTRSVPPGSQVTQSGVRPGAAPSQRPPKSD
jgi:serine O-acetyltransferase